MNGLSTGGPSSETWFSGHRRSPLVEAAEFRREPGKTLLQDSRLVKALHKIDDDDRSIEGQRQGWRAMRASTTIPPAGCLRCRSDGGLPDGVPSAVECLPGCSCVVHSTERGSSRIKQPVRWPRTARLQRIRRLVRRTSSCMGGGFLCLSLSVSSPQASSEHLDNCLNTCCRVRCWVLPRSSICAGSITQQCRISLDGVTCMPHSD